MAGSYERSTSGGPCVESRWLQYRENGLRSLRIVESRIASSQVDHYSGEHRAYDPPCPPHEVPSQGCAEQNTLFPLALSKSLVWRVERRPLKVCTKQGGSYSGISRGCFPVGPVQNNGQWPLNHLLLERAKNRQRKPSAARQPGLLLPQ